MKTFLRHVLLCPIALIIVGLSSSPAAATKIGICTANQQLVRWESPSPNLKYRESDFSPEHEVAILAAVDRANNFTLGVNIFVDLTTGGVASRTDGINSIVMNAGAWAQFGDGGNAAVTRVELQSLNDPENCHLHKEIDIFLRPDFNWTTNIQIDPTSTSTLRNMFVRVFHELGHFYGLANAQGIHENSKLAVMNEFFPHGGVIGNSKQVRFLPDDLEGLNFLYGGLNTADVMSSSFELSGPSSGKATLIRPKNTVTAQTLPVLTNFTVGNRGDNLTSATVKFYFSLDDHIDPAIDFLSETEKFVLLNGGEIVTSMALVDVPAGIPAAATGTDYYLGYDANALLGIDFDPTNDAVALYKDQIKIFPSSTPLPAPTCSYEFAGCFLNRPNWLINVNPDPNFPLPIIDYEYEKSYNNGATWDPAGPSAQCNVWTGEQAFQHITTSAFTEILRVEALSELGSGAYCYLYLYYNCGGGGGMPQ